MNLKGSTIIQSENEQFTRNFDKKQSFLKKIAIFDFPRLPLSWFSKANYGKGTRNGTQFCSSDFRNAFRSSKKWNAFLKLWLIIPCLSFPYWFPKRLKNVGHEGSAWWGAIYQFFSQSILLKNKCNKLHIASPTHTGSDWDRLVQKVKKWINDIWQNFLIFGTFGSSSIRIDTLFCNCYDLYVWNQALKL